MVAKNRHCMEKLNKVTNLWFLLARQTEAHCVTVVLIPSMKESVVFNWSNKADNLQLQVHLSTGNVIPVVNC